MVTEGEHQSEEEDHNEEEDQNEEESEQEINDNNEEEEEEEEQKPVPKSKEVPKVNRNLPFKCLLIKIGKDKYNHKYYSKFRVTWDKLISILELFETNNPMFDLSDIRGYLTSTNKSREQLKRKLDKCMKSWREGHPKNGQKDKQYRRQFKQYLFTLIDVVNKCIEEYGNSV